MTTINLHSEKVNGKLGARVRQLRKSAGLTQETISKECGIFRTYLSRIEGGVANPTVSVVASLAAALNVKVGDLFHE